MNRRLPWPMLLMLWNGFNEIMVKKLHTGFRYASYEVMIPRKLTHRDWKSEPQSLTYLLQVEGKDQILHLRQKRGLVPKHFPVFTYDKQGHIQTDYPFVRDNCYYRGFVQDNPSSRAALSTCSGGLRGVFQVENKTYEIEPVQASHSFQHVVYRLEEKDDAIHMKCGLTEEEQHHQAAMIRSSENIEVEDPELEWWTHTRYADIAIVVEHQRYIKFDRNESTTLLHILNIMDISNLLYEALGVHLTTVGVEIWSEKNLIEITNNINDTLKIFNEWRRDSLLKRVENDAAHLFAYKYFGEIHGLSYFAEICSPEKASGVESYRASSLFLLSNIFVHELGHNLGIQHDGKYCYCERSFCIMSDVLTYSDRFSNCSYRDYFRLRNTGCLLIPPDPKKIYKVKLCGNAVVDEGEQCDCGSPAKCVFDPCCQSDCTLRPDAICAFGECCYDCQYVPAGTTCREEDGICDLPEYCNGTSEWCPEDVYVQDGAPCNNGIYCYHGKCTTHEVQCRDIFGDRATAASESCFRLLNAQGDRFGNCGLRHGVYEKCTAENILCGRIQCENVEELPSLQEHSTVIQTAFGNRQCWSVDYHPGMKIFDIGKIVDGTPCSTDMLCIDGKCMNVSHLKYDCDLKKCNNRGVCNTYKNCHCDYGWAPPYCAKEGHGGSINSGPPAPYLLGFLIAILFTNSLAVVCIGLCVLYRKKVKRQWRRLCGRTN